MTGAGPAGAGGGIFAFLVTLTLNNCVVTGNSESAGGGILNHNGTAHVNTSVVSGNTGPGGTLTIANSRIGGNTAFG